MKNPLDAELTEENHALVVFAEKLTREPWNVTSDSVQLLREQGFTDLAIHDATQVVALFNYYNRIADGLGVVVSDDD